MTYCCAKCKKKIVNIVYAMVVGSFIYGENAPLFCSDCVNLWIKSTELQETKIELKRKIKQTHLNSTKRHNELWKKTWKKHFEKWLKKNEEDTWII